VRSMASASSVSMSRIMRLLHHDPVPLLMVIPMQEGQHARDEEENAVHDAKYPACLEHRTCLVGVHVESVHGDTAQGPRDCVARSATDVRAIRLADEAQFVHAGDQGAYKAEVDEGDEHAVRARSVPSKECRNGPGSA